MGSTEYVIIIREEDGIFWTDVPSLPGTGSQGKTLEEAVINTQEAIGLMLEHLRDQNEPVPHPKEVIVKVSVPA